jgi:hypothetical protein
MDRKLIEFICNSYMDNINKIKEITLKVKNDQENEGNFSAITIYKRNNEKYEYVMEGFIKDIRYQQRKEDSTKVHPSVHFNEYDLTQSGCIHDGIIDVDKLIKLIEE